VKLAAVVPAAGLSRRMGREKILLPFGRSTILETILEKLEAAQIEERVVVLREDLPEAADRARRMRARVVLNPRPEEEMLLSIRLGLAAIPAGSEAVFIWPADHPAAAIATVELLGGKADPARALLPVYRGRRGHPALLGRDLLAAVASIPPHEGLRYLWRARAEAVFEIAVDDPGVVLDLNTPEDYQNAVDTAT